MHLHTINYFFKSKIAKNIILIMLHPLIYWILRSPLIHDIVGYDHRKDSLQVNQPIPVWGLHSGWNKDTFGCEFQCSR